MDKSNTVPTAIAFIVFVGLIIGGILYIKSTVSGNYNRNHEESIKEIGKLPNILVGIKYGDYFTAVTQVSNAAKNFISFIPTTVQMKDEGQFEKKGCGYFHFEGDSEKSKQIQRGDLLVYGDSCIVIAKGDFNGTSLYKKIGHIDDMPDLPDGNIEVNFSTIEEGK